VTGERKTGARKGHLFVVQELKTTANQFAPSPLCLLKLSRTMAVSALEELRNAPVLKKMELLIAQIGEEEDLVVFVIGDSRKDEDQKWIVLFSHPWLPQFVVSVPTISQARFQVERHLSQAALLLLLQHQFKVAPSH
jgi:hypothetical protein